jgi:hypothetical protein
LVHNPPPLTGLTAGGRQKPGKMALMDLGFVADAQPVLDAANLLHFTLAIYHYIILLSF